MAEIQNTNSMFSNPQVAYQPAKTTLPSGQQTVNISTPNNAQIYQYPTSSLYTKDPNQASGVNIYIYNPSGLSTGNTTMPSPQVVNSSQPSQNTENNTPIANTPLKDETKKEDNKTEEKEIVELTDDYIKTLESYLRSPEETVRKTGLIDLIKRFEEDSSRYDDPALTALLNIALQDSSANNRMLAMTPIAAEYAHGDENTIKILNELTKSDKIYGQEAKMATEALLKAAQSKSVSSKEKVK